MDPRLKERLIGAAVLVALAVWLIPWILDGREQAPQSASVPLLLPPAEESAPVRTQTVDLSLRGNREAAQPQRSGESDPGDRLEASRVASSVEAARAPPPETVSRAAAAAETQIGAAGDWMVQLGSFGERENAERLAGRVTTFGFEPDVSTYQAGGRPMYRVRLGPYESRGRADATASSLSAHGFLAQVITAN